MKNSKKISFITTIFNEEKTIDRFLDSLLSQTKLPHEIVIVDGNSTDATVSKITKYGLKFKKKRITFKTITKAGNRSVGRNEAIKQATGDIIVCSDSGNILHKDWLQNIVKPFINSDVDVVAGFYKGKAANIFQKCVIPYALVMKDKVNKDTFLPATRSVAFKKSIWKKVGKFDESLSHNEDYVFARKLKEIGARIVFAEDAIVYWLPRKNLKQVFVMIWRFAFGDAEAKILRTNVALLFARYIIGFYFILLCALYKSILGVVFAMLLLLAYILWSVQKNYRYVKDVKAFYILPSIQFTADIAVLSGTVLGVLKRIKKFNTYSFIVTNKFLIFVLFAYVAVLLATLQWAIPNSNHPFPYHMDEWHQLQAVGNTFRFGTPNTAGSANGTMFHFLLSGLYLIPFTVLQLVNPFSLEIDNAFMRERIFEILRIQTIFFGIFSIVVLYKIAELINASKKITIMLFTFTPIWLSLSGYFKYDIALLFWIVLSVWFFLWFAKNPNGRNFIIAALPASLAMTVKISALPLLVIYFISYFWFIPLWKKNLRYLFAGIGIFVFCLILFGMPDTLFGKGNILDYLYQNIISTPNSSSEAYSGINAYIYLFVTHFPLIFGHGLVLLFLSSIITGAKIIVRNKIALFIFFCLTIFLISLLPLKITSAGNRSLVLLPFLVLLIGFFWNQKFVTQKRQAVAVSLLIIIMSIQVFESYAFLYIKTVRSPQEIASSWITKNIPKNTMIGIENIPIYQQVPDIVQKEFYFSEYNIKQSKMYNYEVISSQSEKLPRIVIVTNESLEPKILRSTDKKNLVERLLQEGYKKRAVFNPDIKYYKIIGNDVDYYYSGLIAVPWSTSIYEK